MLYRLAYLLLYYLPTPLKGKFAEQEKEASTHSPHPLLFKGEALPTPLWGRY